MDVSAAVRLPWDLAIADGRVATRDAFLPAGTHGAERFRPGLRPTWTA